MSSVFSMYLPYASNDTVEYTMKHKQTCIQDTHIQDQHQDSQIQDQEQDLRVSRPRPICQRQFASAKPNILSEEKRKSRRVVGEVDKDQDFEKLVSRPRLESRELQVSTKVICNRLKIVYTNAAANYTEQVTLLSALYSNKNAYKRQHFHNSHPLST